MTNSSKHIADALDFLNKEVEYAMLRNYEGLPYDNASRDIDIIITDKEFKKHKAQIIEVLTKDDWKLFSYLNNGRLITFVCTKLFGTELGIVQWDFFINTSVHGVELASAKEMIASREFNGVVYHVSKDYEFLDKYLYNRAVGAEYPKKYIATREAIAKSEVIKAKLKQVFGYDDMDVIDKMSGKTLLMRGLISNFKNNPVLAVWSVIASIFIYLRDFICSSTAPRFCFTGADGAGKTTVINLIQEKLAPVYGKATMYFHFRPLLIPNMGEAAHNAGLKKEVDREYDKPHRGTNKGFISSMVRLKYYSLDYILGFWVKVKPHCKITRVVIFDRYFNDVIVDSRRSAIHLNPKFLYYWGKLFIPKMNYNFLVTADVDIIRGRKQELDRKGIERINSRIQYLATRKNYYLIYNNGTAEEGACEILKILIDKQNHRISKKLS